MSITSGFYDSRDGDRLYNTVQIASIFDGVIMDGIYASIGNKFMVKSDAGMNLLVTPGRGWFNHSWVLNDADYPVTISASEAVLDRMDSVILEINRSESVRGARVIVVKGTPASNPEPPELTTTDAISQVSLADVMVRAGTSIISQGDITNNVGTSKCPFVTGVLSTVTTTELISQWEAQFEILFARMKKAVDDLSGGIVPEGSVSVSYSVKVPVGSVTEAGQSGYMANVPVVGLKATDDAIIDLDFSKVSDVDAIELSENFSVYKATCKEGSLELKMTDKPSVELPLKLKCIRK